MTRTLAVALLLVAGCASIAGIDEIKPLRSRAGGEAGQEAEEPENSAGQGGNAPGGTANGGNGNKGGAASGAGGAGLQGSGAQGNGAQGNGAQGSGAQDGGVMEGGAQGGGDGGGVDPAVCLGGGTEFGFGQCSQCQTARSADCCQSVTSACSSSAACSAYVGCRAACDGDLVCAVACAEQNPDGVFLHDSLAYCLLGDGTFPGACGIACETHHGSQAPDPKACGDGGAGYSTCIECDSAESADCCLPSYVACYGQTPCMTLAVCITKCKGTSSCVKTCRNKHAPSLALYDAYDQCLHGGSGAGNGACGLVCD